MNIFKSLCVSWLLLLLVACQGQAAACGPAEATPIKVLFIGNSYTMNNNLPDLFAQMACAGHHSVEVKMLAEGGWTLAQHQTANQTKKILQGTAWDFVVLQEQSVIPALADEREFSMYPAGRLLVEQIRATSAQPIFYMTWGRKNGLESQGFTNYANMQKAINTGYFELAEELNVSLAPVGSSWRNALNENPQLELWVEDNSHPTVAGSYLAAAVFYAVIFQENPADVAGFTAGLAEEQAHFLRKTAGTTVLSNPERWRLP